MRQVTQYQKTGELRVEELPAPRLRPGGVLVRNVASLISTGTERTSVETAQASMLGKARSRPDLVKQVIDTAKREGVMETYRKVQTRLDNVKELGYSSAGVVLESDVEGIAPGDRVACAGTAYHAEIVSVSRNLTVRMPDDVGFDEAAFVALGAIALQGVRQADLRVGESAAVIGLGLVGLLTVQLLKAQGCRVIGLDVRPDNFELARSLGCDACAVSGEDAVLEVEEFTRGYGTDGVVIAASTSSSQPVELAMQIARRRSTVVVVGAVGLTVPRSPFYEKEVDLRISCSYGPGRYDTTYEQEGIDYPIGYVRWTENRNMEGFLQLIADGRVDTRVLISHRFPIERALEAYDVITGVTKERCFGVVLEYPESPVTSTRVELAPAAPVRAAEPAIGFIGAGKFAQAYLLPPLQKAGAQLRGVATSSPVSARGAGEKFGFAFCATDPSEVVADEGTNAVVVATRHDSHARYVQSALAAGKHVLVEKPLAIDDDQLGAVAVAGAEAAGRGLYLAVGFNRRFSAPFTAMTDFFADRTGPMCVLYRVNAGRIPRDSWIQAPDQGGRLVGEGCHMIDCFAALTKARPVSVHAHATRSDNSQTVDEDTVVVTVLYSDGSIGTLVYVANGSTEVRKEYCEVTADGRTAIMSDFRELVLHHGRTKKRSTFDGRKGHAESVSHFLDVVRGSAAPVFTLETLVDTTRVTLAARESLRTRSAVVLEG